MVDVAAAARRILIDLDVASMRRLHAEQSPHLPAGSDADVLSAMHLARTELDNIPLRDREYSHRWLTERDLPSRLPPQLWPKPDRFVPRIVEGVGIMVAAQTEEMVPAALAVRKQMEEVVLDAYADSDSPDPAKLHKRMMKARRRELRGLVLPDRAR